MSGLAALSDNLRGQLQGAVDGVRRRIFGANNEQLDFIMDSFYKLSPPQRTGVLAGIVIVIAGFVLSAVMLFFSQADRLTSDLSNSFDATHELDRLSMAYKAENAKFDKLVDVVQRKTQRVRMKPFFEKIAKNLGVTIDNVDEKKVPLPVDNPLQDKLQEVVVDLRMSNISIPKLLNFLVEVEKANKYLRVQDLQIRGRYGTRLYFDSQVKVRGYNVK